MLLLENTTIENFDYALTDFNFTSSANITNTSECFSCDAESELEKLNIPYATMEILVAVIAVIG